MKITEHYTLPVSMMAMWNPALKYSAYNLQQQYFKEVLFFLSAWKSRKIENYRFIDKKSKSKYYKHQLDKPLQDFKPGKVLF